MPKRTPKKKLRLDSRRVRKLERVEEKLKQSVRKEKKPKALSASELKSKLNAPLVMPKIAEKNRHPERRPSKVEVIQRDTYAVFVDFHARTCIRVGAGREYTYFIPMDSAGMDVQQLRHEQFDARFKPYGYPLLRAAKLYAESAQSFGYTEKARQHLEAILSGSTSTKEIEMAKKQPMKKAAEKKRVVFDAKKMIVKGNKEVLKKARSARMVGAAVHYADKTIKHLVKSVEAAGLRAGTARAAMLAFVLKHKNTDDVLGKTVKAGKTSVEIRGDNLAGMVKRKHIALS